MKMNYPEKYSTTDVYKLGSLNIHTLFLLFGGAHDTYRPYGTSIKTGDNMAEGESAIALVGGGAEVQAIARLDQ